MRSVASVRKSIPAVVARQGIYDTSRQLVAFELLFRSKTAEVETADILDRADGDAATAQVLVTAFSEIGLDALVGTRRAFVNVPYDFLTKGFCSTLPADRVVLEILEDVEVDRRVIETARGLVAQGHTLALDDFVFQPGMEALIELAEVVKLDVLALTPRELAEQVALLRPYGVGLLAEKVESEVQIPELLAMGFSYFQGYALQRPTVVRGDTTEINRTVLLQILSEVQRPNVSARDLVETVGRDPSIVYALLRILNSAQLSLASRVTSLQQALVLFGIDRLRNWTSMLVMSRLAPDAEESLSGALVRAKLCELCVAAVGGDPAPAFTAGLLSALPSLSG